MRQLMPSRRTAAGATVLLAAVAAGTPVLLIGQTERFEVRGSTVAIYNLVGEVAIRPGSGAVRVEVTRGGRDAGELSIEQGPIGDFETLRVIYPANDIVYTGMSRRSSTEMRVRDDGTFGDSDRSRWSGRGDRVRIEGDGRGLEAYADLDITVPPGQHVRVYLGAGEVTATNVNGELYIDTHSAPVSASGTRGVLDIDVGSGQVDVRTHQGDLNLDTGSGRVDVTGVSGRSVLIDTGSGSVTANDLSGQSINIDTGSGRITAQNVSAPDIILDTGSGPVELDVTGTAESIEIDTGSGSVTVWVPESFGARVEIETGSGGIEMEMPLTMRRWSRDHVSGTIGDGSGRLVVDTGSGSIRIRSR